MKDYKTSINEIRAEINKLCELIQHFDIAESTLQSISELKRYDTMKIKIWNLEMHVSNDREGILSELIYDDLTSTYAKIKNHLEILSEIEGDWEAEDTDKI